VNGDIPKTLYYKLDPIFESDIPIQKRQIGIDNEVLSNNELQTLESLYSVRTRVSIKSTSEFNYTIGNYPEKGSYISTSDFSNISYRTNSKLAYGPINDFKLISGGSGYKILPSISNVVSSFGSGAIVTSDSDNIGNISKAKVNDIGFDFPSDSTLKPSVLLPQVINVESLTSIESIGITSVGRGYSVSPTLLVFDGKTNQQVKDIDLNYTLGDSQVTILKNTFGLNNTTPKIIPTKNSNGVGISTIGFSTVTKDVTVTLSVGFSTEDSFPFAINDKVMIENVSVGYWIYWKRI